jgi:hypothetical protein
LGVFPAQQAPSEAPYFGYLGWHAAGSVGCDHWRTIQNQAAPDFQRRNFHLWVESLLGPQLSLPLAVLTTWLAVAWLPAAFE